MNTMRSSVLLAALAALALAFALAAPGAGAVGDPPAPRHDAPDPHIADGTLQQRLDGARKRWKAGHLRSYRYTLQVSCFCPPNKAVYVVRNGVPRTSAKTDKHLATVPRLFKIVQGAIDHKVAALTATYSARGVPRSISIDGSRRIADDEVGYSLTHFTATG
jgi:hypothetical protein